MEKNSIIVALVNQHIYYKNKMDYYTDNVFVKSNNLMITNQIPAKIVIGVVNHVLVYYIQYYI